MHDLLGMRVGETFKQLPHDRRDLSLGGHSATLLEVIDKILAFDVLDHDEEGSLILEVLVELENVRVLQRLQRVDLSDRLSSVLLTHLLQALYIV